MIYKYLLILNLFIFEYLHQFYFLEGDERGICSKAPPWKFVFKMKIKQHLAYPNKKYNAIFVHIHHNIRAYPISKKIWIDQWLGKYYCILEKISVKWGVG